MRCLMLLFTHLGFYFLFFQNFNFLYLLWVWTLKTDGHVLPCVRYHDKLSKLKSLWWKCMLYVLQITCIWAEGYNNYWCLHYSWYFAKSTILACLFINLFCWSINWFFLRVCVLTLNVLNYSDHCILLEYHNIRHQWTLQIKSYLRLVYKYNGSVHYPFQSDFM